MFKRLTDSLRESLVLYTSHVVESVDVCRDTNRDLRNTYVTRKENVYIIHAVYYSNHFSELVLTLESRKGNIFVCTFEEVDFSFPETGYFSLCGQAVFLSRVPRRQWRKGMNDAVLSYSVPYDQLMSRFFGYGLREYLPSFQQSLTAGHIHFPVYGTFLESLNKLKDSDCSSLSCALSLDYALCLHPITSKITLLFRHGVEAADIEEDGSFTIRPESLWLKSSIEEILKCQTL